MPGALNTGINLSDALGDISRLEDDLSILRGRLMEEVDAAVEETAREFRDEVKNQLRASDIDSDTGELMNSWVVRPRGLAEYEVRSTADHAVYLELGTRPHEITARDGGWLKFIPDNPAPYPEREFTKLPDGEVVGDYHESGLVTSSLDPLADASPNTYFAKSVMHPGNEAYGYFDDAYNKKSWKTTLNNNIRWRVRRLLEEFEASG